MEKFKAYVKMMLYILCIMGIFCLFLQFVSIYDKINASFGCLALVLLFGVVFVAWYYLISLLHGQIIYLDYLNENEVVVVKRKGVKYFGNFKNSDLVISIFKSGEFKLLDVVPVDVFRDMSKLMEKVVAKAHV